MLCLSSGFDVLYIIPLHTLSGLGLSSIFILCLQALMYWYIYPSSYLVCPRAFIHPHALTVLRLWCISLFILCLSSGFDVYIPLHTSSVFRLLSILILCLSSGFDVSIHLHTVSVPRLSSIHMLWLSSGFDVYPPSYFVCPQALMYISLFILRLSYTSSVLRFWCIYSSSYCVCPRAFIYPHALTVLRLWCISTFILCLSSGFVCARAFTHPNVFVYPHAFIRPHVFVSSHAWCFSIFILCPHDLSALMLSSILMFLSVLMLSSILMFLSVLMLSSILILCLSSCFHPS